MTRRLLLAICCMALTGSAQVARVPTGATEPPPQLENVGIDQKLDSQIPLDAVVRDEQGHEVTLGQLLGKRPAILALVYYECPMLCNMVLNGALRAAKALTLNAGSDYDVIALSFDPAETPDLARRKKEEYIERYNRPGAEQGWRFLTANEVNIQKVTAAAGFRYARDPANNQWAHASAILVLTPGGRVARYFFGVEYSARDLRFGLVEAAEGRVGTAVDQILLYCFHYDPATGKYSLAVMNTLRAGGVLTVSAILIFWLAQYRRGRKKQQHEIPVIS
jgi:protein SCO1/2